jgi:hypothetical protein
MTYAQAEKEARDAWEELGRHYGSSVALDKSFDQLHPAQRKWLVSVTWHIRTTRRR